MHSEPLISVIINIKQSAEKLKKCLDTLLFQLYKNIEIICIDNGLSEENTALLYTYKPKFDRFEIFHIIGSKTGQNWNEGLTKSEGKYIHFVNSDCWFLLDLYKVFANTAAIKEPDISIINSALYKEDIIDIPYYELFDDEDLSKLSDDMIYSYKDIKHIMTKNLRVFNKIYKKEFLENNNLSFTENNIYCEYLFNIQTLLKSSTVYINPEVYMRTIEHNIVEDVTEKVFDIFNIINRIERFLIDENIFKYYVFDIFNYICNTLDSYYNYCPEELKEEYFNRMHAGLLSRFNSMPPNAQEVFKNIEEANFLLTSTYEEYRLKKQG